MRTTETQTPERRDVERRDAATRGRGDAARPTREADAANVEAAESGWTAKSDLTAERLAPSRVAAEHEAEKAAARGVAVSINHVSKTYPVPLRRLKQLFRRKSAKAAVEALRDVSFDIRAGEVFGLIGRNGAGKTTLTKIIATLVQPTDGTISVHGFDSVREEERVRARVGLATAEERSFYWRLTAQQNLLFFARLYGLTDRDARRRITELLSLIELEPVARRRFGELSTGNKQRMAVARALLNSPPVLLLDEPTRSLDPVAAARLRALIQSLAQASPPATILLTSHNLAEVEELCGRVAIISQGRIRALDTPAGLRALHRQQERVTLNLRGISAARATQLLGDALGGVECESVEQHEDLRLTLVRQPEDELLDRALRALHEGGARLVSVETERATLLDVIEHYERDERAASKDLKEGGR